MDCPDCTETLCPACQALADYAAWLREYEAVDEYNAMLRRVYDGVSDWFTGYGVGW